MWLVTMDGSLRALFLVIYPAEAASSRQQSAVMEVSFSCGTSRLEVGSNSEEASSLWCCCKEWSTMKSVKKKSP